MSFTFNVPTKLIFGAGKIAELSKQRMPGKKALILTSAGTSAVKSGALPAVTAAMEETETEYVIFDKVPANPQEPVLAEGVELLKSEGCDFVIGVGGGSVLDAATIIASFGTQPEGRIWDYVRGGSGGGMKRTVPGLPYIEVTTSAGTGSEVDCWGVVTNPDTGEKIGMQGDYPAIAIVDPELMRTVPPRFTAYQGFDALLHNIEGYLSKFHNEMADMVELTAIRAIAENLPRAVENGEDITARTQVAYGNTLGGYSMEISSCISEHSMEHAMSGHHPELPHGAGLIMITEAYFGFMIERGTCAERFVELACAMGKPDAESPQDFLDALHALIAACRVDDLKMSDYGITAEELPQLAEDARSMMKGLFLCDPQRMSNEDITEIFRRAYR